MRYMWGIYLRLYLDWDWNVAEHLFELLGKVEPSTAPIATASLDAGKADTWNIFTETSVLTEVKIAYKSTTGETKYRSIMICPSTDDVASAGELSNVAGGHHQPRHAGEEETEDEAGVITQDGNDVGPFPEAESELGVKQVVEKQEVVLIIPGEPSCGGRKKDREGSEVVAYKDSDATQAQETEIGVKDNGYIVDSTDGVSLEEIMTNLEANQEQDADQISICSLD